MDFATMTYAELLEKLAEDYGYDNPENLLEEFITDSVAPGICTECGYTTEYEPDQEKGYCEICNKNTVISAMVLAGII